MIRSILFFPYPWELKCILLFTILFIFSLRSFIFEELLSLEQIYVNFAPMRLQSLFDSFQVSGKFWTTDSSVITEESCFDPQFKIIN